MMLKGSLGGMAALAFPRWALAEVPGLEPVYAEIAKRHNESVQRLQEWIRQPSIAAEKLGMPEGCDLTIRLLLDAGFDRAVRVPTGGQPGIFATLDAGAPRTMGLYFMYDVKQANPAEWSSPPWAAALVDKPGLGKVVMGRGAVNQKGPQAALLAALHAIRGAGRKLPVNLVLVAEGEEEIGSPHFPELVQAPEVQAALGKCAGIFMPAASQDDEGVVSIALGSKGLIELELVASGEKWGRGPHRDIHSSNKARVDSPAWHLVQALSTLVTRDGEPAIDGFANKARPLTRAEKAMIADIARRSDERQEKQQLGVDRWIRDVGYRESLELLVSRPTVNIEGIVAGYTGPGGKTILPHQAVAKMDLRLVPDMTAKEALATLQAHLAKRGFGDIEVRMTGGYDPNSTPVDSDFIRSQIAIYKRQGTEPIIWPRTPGSWPGYVFTGEPLRLPAGRFGLGNGDGAHAPDEYFLVDSVNPKVQGMDGAVRSFVEYLYALAESR
jgi:acetylornithine deacetylase/succinyl-diaminopimelate desuccinylase-like protein